MLHVNSGGDGDDFNNDEVKVFKDEGEYEIRSSEVLAEEKSDLIDLIESAEKSGSYSSSKNVSRSDLSPVFGETEPTPHTSSFNMGYLESPYPYPNGAGGPIAVSMASKMGLAPPHPGAALPFFCHNGDHLTQPPPEHMEIPPYQLDAEGAGAMGLSSTSMYPFSAGSIYPYPMLSPELGHHTQSDHNYGSSSLDHKNSSSSRHSSQDSKTQDSGSQNDKKKPRIKKPLNAFMLFLKEIRAKVVAECTLKESAVINAIIGRRWHGLGPGEQAKYYELARRERQLHMQLYPDWKANSTSGKKRIRKPKANDGGNNVKKCRAQLGVDRQSQWCKRCRGKKKCTRYLKSGKERGDNQSEDNLGSCGSFGEAKNPLPSFTILSRWSGCTVISNIDEHDPSTSLASPSVSLASPCMSLQSPSTPPTFDMNPIMPIGLPPLNRNPVDTNPHDVNNPLTG